MISKELLLLLALALVAVGLYVWNNYFRKQKQTFSFMGCFGHHPTMEDDMRIVQERYQGSKEERCRRIFEQYFYKSRLKFPRARPAFLC